MLVVLKRDWWHSLPLEKSPVKGRGRGGRERQHDGAAEGEGNQTDTTSPTSSALARWRALWLALLQRSSLCVEKEETSEKGAKYEVTSLISHLCIFNACSAELLWIDPAEPFEFGGDAPHPPHAQPKGMRCIEVALRYGLVSSMSRSWNFLQRMCAWMCVKIFPRFNCAIHSSTELIRFNLAAQPLVLSRSLSTSFPSLPLPALFPLYIYQVLLFQCPSRLPSCPGILLPSLSFSLYIYIYI